MKANEILPISQTLKKIGTVVAYYPRIALALKSVNAAIFLAQFIYWEGKQKNEEGWIYKTMEEIRKETGLSRNEQETARKRLKELNILEEKRMGIPAKLYFRFNWDVLDKILSEFEDEEEGGNNEDCENEPANKIAENQQTRLQETCKQDCGKPANYIHKITTDNTTIDYNYFKETEEFKPYWVSDVNYKTEALMKVTTWKRYPHPTRPGITTTIRQMVMDIVCINRMKRELFPTEEEVCIKIQLALNNGKLTYEKFVQVYKEWEKSNVPRIGWLHNALFGKELQPQSQRTNKINKIPLIELCPRCGGIMLNKKCKSCK